MLWALIAALNLFGTNRLWQQTAVCFQSGLIIKWWKSPLSAWGGDDIWVHSFWTETTVLNPNEIMVGQVCKRHRCITLPQERLDWRKKGHILSESERTFTHPAAVAPLWDHIIHSRMKLNIITVYIRHFFSDVAEGKFPKSRFISNIHLGKSS